MKRKLQLSLLICTLLTGSAIAQYAYFPFDADALDANEEINSTAESGGVTYVMDEERANVMELDGAAGYITYPGNDVYYFDALTYNIWFKWTTAVADQWWVRIFDFGLPSDMPDHPGNHDVVFLTTYQEGLLSWHIHSVDWTDGQDTILWSDEPIMLNEWYMLTCTHDADSAKLYLNGVLQDAKSVNGVAPSDLSFLNMYLGSSNWPDPLFTGRMDEFTIWDEVLDQEAITALYTFPEVPDAAELHEGGNSRIFSYANNLVVELENVSGNASMAVYNLQGKEVFNESGLDSRTEISNMQTGIYIVRVFVGTEVFTEKVLIQ